MGTQPFYIFVNHISVHSESESLGSCWYTLHIDHQHEGAQKLPLKKNGASPPGVEPGIFRCDHLIVGERLAIGPRGTSLFFLQTASFPLITITIHIWQKSDICSLCQQGKDDILHPFEDCSTIRILKKMMLGREGIGIKLLIINTKENNMGKMGLLSKRH